MILGKRVQFRLARHIDTGVNAFGLVETCIRIAMRVAAEHSHLEEDHGREV